MAARGNEPVAAGAAEFDGTNGLTELTNYQLDASYPPSQPAS